MFGNGHKQHTFERLAEVYDRHSRALQIEIKTIQSRLQQLQSVEQNVESNIRRVRGAKDERILELQAALADIDARLTAQLKAKLLSLQGMFSSPFDSFYICVAVPVT